MSLLSISNLSIQFAERTVLRDVTMGLLAKGCTVLMGPSGTGKSTLLRFLAGHLDSHPTARVSGDVFFQGIAWPPPAFPALVEQKPQLLVSTVHENLVTHLSGRSQLTRRQQEAMLGERLTSWGFAELISELATPVVELSRPLQRAVSILRYAVASPALLMLDEPTAGVDTNEAERLWALIEQIGQTACVLVVTHHLGQAKKHGQHVVLMADGVIKEDADVNTFFTHPRSAIAQHFIRTGSCPEGIFDEIELKDHPEHDPHIWHSAGMATSPSAGPNGFVWLIPGEVAGTPLPGIIRHPQDDLNLLRQVGIGHLVSLTELAFDHHLAMECGIACSSFPIRDMHAPDLDQAIALCHQIDALRKSGTKVAVHCKAGLGRTGTLLAAYWIWQGKGKVNSKDAIQCVRGLSNGMIQSAVQEEFLHQFSAVVYDHCSKVDL